MLSAVMAIFIFEALPFDLVSHSRSFGEDDTKQKDDALEPGSKRSDKNKSKKKDEPAGVNQQPDKNKSVKSKPGKPKKEAEQKENGKQDDNQKAEDKLRSRILKLLGDKEDGHFLLVLKKTSYKPIVTMAPTPRNARRSGNKWQEVIYQVELIEGRQEAADYLAAFAAYIKQPSQKAYGATYDWRLVKHVEDSEEAELNRKKTVSSANKKSATRLNKTSTGLKFYRPITQTKPAQPPQDKVAK